VANAPLSAEQEFYSDGYRGTDVSEPIVAHVGGHDHALWDRLVGPLDGKRVLEVGAGSGMAATWLASRGAHVTAVELSPEGCSTIERQAAFHDLAERVSVVCGDACAVDSLLTTDSIDVALGFSVLHHLPAQQFGQALRHVLRPGGHALFLENWGRNPLYRLGRRIRNAESPSGRPMSADDVDAFIREVGEGERVYPFFGLFRHIPKYVLTDSRLLGRLMVGLDELIDRVPATRRWSAHIWVYARKT
jgi:SAM-dependent methyltransferase